MKIKLFNGKQTNLNLTVLGGGYDADSGRVQLIVRGDSEQQVAGVVLFDVSEAYTVSKLMTANTPTVTRVGDPVAGADAEQPVAAGTATSRIRRDRTSSEAPDA